jgi:hypothetical protein
MFSTADDESQAKAAALRPWVRRIGVLAGLDLAVTLTCAGALLAKDNGLLGGYHGGGTSLLVNLLFLAGPALGSLALGLFGLGVTGWRRVGAGHGFGVALLGGLALLPLSVLGSLLALGLAAAG